VEQHPSHPGELTMHEPNGYDGLLADPHFFTNPECGDPISFPPESRPDPVLTAFGN